MKHKRAVTLLAAAILLSAGTVAYVTASRPSIPTTIKIKQRENDQPGPPKLFQAPPFAFLDQSGQPFSESNLHGKIWISDFFFTQCAGSCPVMTSKMVSLTKDLPESNIAFVSFSVDPARDDTASLSAYAQKASADPRWHFLKPPDHKHIFNVVQGMKIGGQDGHDDILHADKFILTDATGHVRGIYDSTKSDEMKKLVTDAQTLARGS